MEKFLSIYFILCRSKINFVSLKFTLWWMWILVFLPVNINLCMKRILLFEQECRGYEDIWNQEFPFFYTDRMFFIAHFSNMVFLRHPMFGTKFYCVRCSLNHASYMLDMHANKCSFPFIDESSQNDLSDMLLRLLQFCFVNSFVFFNGATFWRKYFIVSRAWHTYAMHIALL